MGAPDRRVCFDRDWLARAFVHAAIRAWWRFIDVGRNRLVRALFLRRAMAWKIP